MKINVRLRFNVYSVLEIGWEMVEGFCNAVLLVFVIFWQLVVVYDRMVYSQGSSEVKMSVSLYRPLLNFEMLG